MFSPSSSVRSSWPASSVVPTTEPTDYTPDIERNFVEDCASRGDTTQNFCRCIFNGLRARLSYARFQQLENEFRDNPQTNPLDGPELRPIITTCRTTGGVNPPGTDGANPPSTGD